MSRLSSARLRPLGASLLEEEDDDGLDMSDLLLQPASAAPAAASATLALPLRQLSRSGTTASSASTGTSGASKPRTYPAYPASSTDDDKDLLASSGAAGDSESESERETEPPPSRLSLVLLNVAWIGLAAIVIAWGLVLLPSQVRATVGNDDAGLGLAAIVIVGSLLTMCCTPLIGQLSDRSQAGFGRRRPFLLAGTVCVFFSQLFLGWANPHKPPPKAQSANCTEASSSGSQDGFDTHGSLALLIVVYALATLAYQVVSTPYNGLLADKTPPSMRGFSSGAMGLMSVTGNLFGASVGFLYTSLSIMTIYVLLGLLLVVTVTIVVVSQPERRFRPEKKLPPLSCGHAANEYAAPFRNRDFLWTFFTRFLMQQGMATVMFFLQYYFNDQVPLPDGMRAETAVSYALLPLMCCAAISSLGAGWLSDRLGGRRRIFVEVASFIMAGSAIAMVFTRSFHGCLGIAVIFGLGFGIYGSCDFAIVLDILPNDADRAKDLAVWHQALVLPQLIATPIGGAIRDGVSRNFCNQNVDAGNCHTSRCSAAYIALFSVAAGYFIVSGLLVRLIRGIK